MAKKARKVRTSTQGMFNRAANYAADLNKLVKSGLCAAATERALELHSIMEVNDLYRKAENLDVDDSDETAAKYDDAYRRLTKAANALDDWKYGCTALGTSDLMAEWTEAKKKHGLHRFRDYQEGKNKGRGAGPSATRYTFDGVGSRRRRRRR